MFGIKNIAIMGCGSMADAMAKTIKSVKGAKVYAVESSLVLLEEGVCYDQCVLLAELY